MRSLQARGARTSAHLPEDLLQQIEPQDRKRLESAKADIDRSLVQLSWSYRLLLTSYAALAAAMVYWTYEQLFTKHLQHSLLESLISPAFAQTTSQSHPGLGAVLIQVVFVAIVLAFFISLGMLMFIKDREENRRALDTADNLVKMFGGFLIGVGSSFFGIK